jgi:hypothetical protein
VLFLPVSAGLLGVVPVEGFAIPPSGTNDKRFATLIEYKNGIYNFNQLLLSTILPDINDPPDSHTGDLMPSELREILLLEDDISGRMSTFHVFSMQADRKPVIFVSIDLTNTQQRPIPDGPDVDWLNDPVNAGDRDWRISCHFIDTETGETWSYTAAQFWDLLRDRAVHLPIEEDWQTAPSDEDIESGWFVALLVFNQFFGRPNHKFIVPHDTWTFHADDGDIYAWTRYYGEVRIEKSGIVGLPGGTIKVPVPVQEADGIRPTIMYSGRFSDEDIPRYICICEKLERSTTNEDLPQGQKEVIGLYVGDPFAPGDAWHEFGQFQLEIEDETWVLCQARIVFHDFVPGDTPEEEYDSVMMIGIIRRLFVDQETSEEKLEYFSAILEYNTNGGGKWVVAGKYGGINTIDPVYGERWSADLCLFGDDKLSPRMKEYISQPFAASQMPFAPYETYYSGLP